MKAVGFTFVRNAIIYDYPISEAIQSILPLCDKVVVAVGKSDDETLQLIQSIAPEKVVIVETEWDDSLREGGRVLAQETDKALAAVDSDADWAFYIQGDEVLHEKYVDTIREAMETYADEPKVDGLLFNYKHFYGSYDYVGASSSWYSREIRVVRPNRGVYSYKDAQGFRKGENEKLNVVPVDAYIYHYGWVKKPEAMQKKQENFNRYWHDDEWLEENVDKGDEYNYEKHLRLLEPFDETHPEVMQERVARLNWKFNYDPSKLSPGFKERSKRFLKKLGFEPNYANYKIVKL